VRHKMVQQGQRHKDTHPSTAAIIVAIIAPSAPVAVPTIATAIAVATITAPSSATFLWSPTPKALETPSKIVNVARAAFPITGLHVLNTATATTWATRGFACDFTPEGRLLVVTARKTDCVDRASTKIPKYFSVVHVTNGVFSITSIFKLHKCEARRLASYPHRCDASKLAEFLLQILEMTTFNDIGNKRERRNWDAHFFLNTAADFGSCNVNL
jgi:predicted RNA-binding protein